MAPNGPGGFFPTNPDLAEILGRTDLNFDFFIFLIFQTPNFWISRSPGLQIPRFPDAAASAAAGAAWIVMAASILELQKK